MADLREILGQRRWCSDLPHLVLEWLLEVLWELFLKWQVLRMRWENNFEVRMPSIMQEPQLLQCKKWGSSVKLLVNVGSRWKNCGNDVFRRSFGDFFPLKKLYFCSSYVHYVQGICSYSRIKNKIKSFVFHFSCQCVFFSCPEWYLVRLSLTIWQIVIGNSTAG